MSESSISSGEAREWLEHVVRDELQRIERRRLAEMDDREPGAAEDNRLLDELAGHAYRLLAEKGASALFDPETDDMLSRAHYTDEILSRGQEVLDLLRKDFWSESRHARIRALYRDTFGNPEMDTMRYLELRRLMLKGKAIAYAASLKTANETFDAAVRSTHDYARSNRDAVSDLFSDRDASPAPTSNRSESLPPSPRQPKSAYSPRIDDIVARLVEQKRREGTSSKTLSQLKQVISVFQDITGVQDITRLEQQHVAHYVDTLARLPKTYRKSPRERDRPIGEILRNAENLPDEKKGLASITVNRNLTFVGMVIKRARSEGHELRGDVRLSDLRQRTKTRSRDERRAFTSEDVQRIFRNPLWTGCHSKARRREPGDRIIKDGRYWVPIIAALTGARREEIAGLTAQDVVKEDGIWCFHLRANSNRGLKNLQSERFVPVHSQLVDLGLLEHATRRKGGDLFPDLKPKSDTGSYGDQVDHLFRKILQQQLTDVERKSFHSFRHYVTDVLNNSSDVKPSHRDDLLGHLGTSIGASRYGSGTTLANLKAAVERIPRIQALMHAPPSSG